MPAKAYYAALALLALILPSTSRTAPTVHSTNSNPVCFKHTNPLNPNEKVLVPCGETFVEPLLLSSSPLKYAVSGTGKFQLMFTCDHQRTPSCDKAKDTFQQAFAILESYIVLKANIVVNATFLDFCTETDLCDADGFQVLGGASPANSMQLEDSDGVSRTYPQALLKQLNLSSHPKYAPVNIFCEFNSAANFHFPSDGAPTNSAQVDMLSVVLHELVHGLGFTSSWNDYINNPAKGLTPGITGTEEGTGQFEFTGFVENIFDKFIVETTTGKQMSDRTVALNKIFENVPTTYQNQQSFYSTLQASQAVSSISVPALELATTPNSLGFRAKDGKIMVLESSLTPYSPSSSVSHADKEKYTNTADFIMRFLVVPGVSLQAATKTGHGGPIGPVLLSVLETLGYTTNDNPNLSFAFESSGSTTYPLSETLGRYSLLYPLWTCICFIR